MRPIVLSLSVGLLFSSLGQSAQAASELCIEDPASITINHHLGDAPPVGTGLVVANCGGSTDVLNWSSSFDGDVAPFLTLTPASGAIQPGQGQDETDPTHFGTASQNAHPTHGRQRVVLTLNQSGLISGSFSGQLIFRNDDNPGNTVAVNLTVNITAIRFVPGDTLVGSIDPDSDADYAAFYGIKGMTLRLRFAKSTEVSRLRLTILDTSGAPIKSFRIRTNKTRHKQLTLNEHGLFLLIIESADGSSGSYRIGTGRGLPSNARPRSLNRLKATRGRTVVVKFAALPGALLNASVLPKAPLGVDEISLGFRTPSGQLFDTTGFGSDSLTGLHLVRVPMAEAGIFRLEVSGDFKRRGDRVTVPIWPFQPKGDSLVDLDQ